MTDGFSRIDQELCTGCGNCVSTCPAEAITGERYKPHTISEERCVGCGRCVQVCSAYDTLFEEHSITRAERLRQRGLPPELAEPLFAAYDDCSIAEVRKALADPQRVVVAQCGPAVCSAIAEDFGLATMSISFGQIAAALKRLGFGKVYDFSLPAALAVAEEAYDLVHRLESGGTLPLINSSCPAAVRFIEQFHPELIHHICSCKSPQSIAGALIKSQVAAGMRLDPARIFTVSIGPCTARKLEAGRPELAAGGFPHLDAALTTRELAYMLKESGINIAALAEMPVDSEMPSVEEAVGVYCRPGDVAEAVFLVGSELLKQNWMDVTFVDTESEGVRSASVRLGNHDVKAITVTGLPAAVPFFDAIKKGKSDLSFIELLACPLGCASGGGQPKVLLPQEKAGVYANRCESAGTDLKGKEGIIRNSSVQRIYRESAKTVGDKSNRVLHTEYKERKLGC